MRNLCFDPQSGKLVVVDNVVEPLITIVSQPQEDDNVKKETKMYEIPNSTFKFSILYGKDNVLLRISKDGADLIKYTNLLNDKFRGFSYHKRNSNFDWQVVFDEISNAFNNTVVWQVNDICKYVKSIKDIVIQHDNTIMDKTQKLIDCFNALKESGFIELDCLQEDITQMCTTMLPIIKDCYISELAGLEQLKGEVEEAKLLYDRACYATKHQNEYVDRRMASKPHLSIEGAKKSFANNHKTLISLIETFEDISKCYNEKNSELCKLEKLKSLIENCVMASAEYLRSRNQFGLFLSTIGQVNNAMQQ